MHEHSFFVVFLKCNTTISMPRLYFCLSLVSSGLFQVYFMWLFLLTCTYVKNSIYYQDLEQFCMLKSIQYYENISVSYMSMSIISYLFDVGFFNREIKVHRFFIFKVFVIVPSSIIDLNFDEIFSVETQHSANDMLVTVCHAFDIFNIIHEDRKFC